MLYSTVYSRGFNIICACTKEWGIEKKIRTSESVKIDVKIVNK